MTTLADIYFHPDPLGVLAQLRAEEPLFKLADGRILVTRPADVAALLADKACVTEFPSHRAARRGVRGALADSVARALLSREAPAHTELRRSLSDIYASPSVAGHEEYVRDACRQLLASLGGGGGDLVEVLARPLPYRVNCRLVGLSEQELQEVLPWIHALEAAAHSPEPEVRRAADAAVVEFRRYLADLIADPAALPPGTVLQRLAALRHTSPHLDETDLLDNVKALFFAGAEETTALIGGALAQALARREAGEPVDAARLVEELLRREPPIRHALRWVADDVTCPSGTISAGHVLVLSLTSAVVGVGEADGDGPARDRAVVSFGRGRHKCLGEHLARLQGRTAVTETLALPVTLVRDGEPGRLRSTELQGIGVLPVRVVARA